MLYVDCPYCDTRYPARNLATVPRDLPAPGRRFTVRCAVCNRQFDVEFTQQRRLWGLRPGGLKATSFGQK